MPALIGISSSTISRKRLKAAPFVGIMLLALILRLGIAFLADNSLTFDEPFYNDIVTSMLTGRGYSFSEDAYHTALAYQPTSFQEPGYPFFLATIYSLTHLDDYQTARIVQAVLNTFSVLLLMAIAARIWNRRTALIVGLLSAIDASFLYFTGLLMTENLFIFLILVTFYLWLTAIQQDRLALHLAAGLAFGLACLTRGMILYFLPVFVLVTFYITRSISRRSWYAVAALLIGAIIVITPWTVRNYQLHHAFIPVTTKSGYNLYLYTYPAESLDFNNRFEQIPIPDMSGLSEVQREARFRALAEKNIIDHPLLQLNYSWHKLLDFWNPAAERGPWIIRIAYLIMQLAIMLLAFYGLVYMLAVPKWRAWGVFMGLFLLFHMTAAAIFTGGGKARIIIQPIMILLSGSGLLLLSETHSVRNLVSRLTRHFMRPQKAA